MVLCCVDNKINVRSQRHETIVRVIFESCDVSGIQLGFNVGLQSESARHLVRGKEFRQVGKLMKS